MIPQELEPAISEEFPFIPMPEKESLKFHSHGCLECDYLANDLDYVRCKEINGEVIRLIHREMFCLSAAGWCWALPHYLRFCLTPEAEYNRMETEFLIYNLGPAEQFEEESKERFSLLSQRQISCLLLFLEHLEQSPHWSEYCPENIARARKFIGALRA